MRGKWLRSWGGKRTLEDKKGKLTGCSEGIRAFANDFCRTVLTFI